jgi:Flp pilus assembly protein TadG
MTTMRANRAVLSVSAKEHARSQKGNALLEFALILPVFLALVIGVINISMALYDKTMLIMALQKGARAGAIASTAQVSAAKTAGDTACIGKLISLWGSSSQNITAEIIGSDIKVTGTYTYIGIPNVIPGIPQTIDLTAETTMRLEHP